MRSGTLLRKAGDLSGARAAFAEARCHRAGSDPEALDRMLGQAGASGGSGT